MPASWGVLTMRADIKDVVLCVEQLFKTIVAAAPGNAEEDEPKSSNLASRVKKAHASSEPLPWGSVGMGPVPRKKQLKGES
jgi:protein tyrosine phosphatase (PTP) superfamily phosphohydrolase (DUF442 family)